MSRSQSFWSRRQAAVEAEAQADAEAEARRATKAFEAEQASRSDDEILAEHGLPDPDTLQPGDDFKVFLTDTLPARIRTRALRKLWTTNPVLANVDGLVDYGEDFTDGAKVIANLQTAYQVGKGMKAHVEELARQAEAATNPTDQDDTPEVHEAEEIAQAIEEAQQPDPEQTLASAVDPVSDDTTEDVPPAPRRMRFHFDSTETT